MRRLLDHVGHPVRRLTRTAIGPVQLAGLQTGELRELTLDELGGCWTPRSSDRRTVGAWTAARPVPMPLRPYVAALVAYDVDLGAPGVHVGMPGTTLTFVLPLDEPLDVGWAGVPASTRQSAGRRSPGCTPARRRSTTTDTSGASSWR